MFIRFGTGQHEAIVPTGTINRIAEGIVHDVWNKLPDDARTPEAIKFTVKRAAELVDSMSVAYLPNVEDREEEN